jgi:hypothetical protein
MKTMCPKRQHSFLLNIGDLRRIFDIKIMLQKIIWSKVKFLGHSENFKSARKYLFWLFSAFFMFGSKI